MYYVTMTDKFMSGWGMAEGKINKFVVACPTFDQAEQIERAAHKRDEMKDICVESIKPYFNPSRYLVSERNFSDLGGPWLE